MFCKNSLIILVSSTLPTILAGVEHLLNIVFAWVKRAAGEQGAAADLGDFKGVFNGDSLDFSNDFWMDLMGVFGSFNGLLLSDNLILFEGEAVDPFGQGLLSHHFTYLWVTFFSRKRLFFGFIFRVKLGRRGSSWRACFHFGKKKEKKETFQKKWVIK